MSLRAGSLYHLTFNSTFVWNRPNVAITVLQRAQGYLRFLHHPREGWGKILQCDYIRTDFFFFFFGKGLTLLEIRVYICFLQEWLQVSSLICHILKIVVGNRFTGVLGGVCKVYLPISVLFVRCRWSPEEDHGGRVLAKSVGWGPPLVVMPLRGSSASTLGGLVWFWFFFTPPKPHI